MNYVQTGSNGTKSVFLLVDQNLIQSKSLWLLLNLSPESIFCKVIHNYSSQDHWQGELIAACRAPSSTKNISQEGLNTLGGPQLSFSVFNDLFGNGILLSVCRPTYSLCSSLNCFTIFPWPLWPTTQLNVSQSWNFRLHLVKSGGQLGLCLPNYLSICYMAFICVYMLGSFYPSNGP